MEKSREWPVYPPQTPEDSCPASVEKGSPRHPKVGRNSKQLKKPLLLYRDPLQPTLLDPLAGSLSNEQDEHELAHLYLGQSYNRFGVFDIFKLDLEAILTIMEKAKCFSAVTQTEARSLKKNVVNSWMRVTVEDWTHERTLSAFSDMNKLVNHNAISGEFQKAQLGLQEDHPYTEFLLNIRHLDM